MYNHPATRFVYLFALGLGFVLDVVLVARACPLWRRGDWRFLVGGLFVVSRFAKGARTMPGMVQMEMDDRVGLID